jgi:hypothetical protein
MIRFRNTSTLRVITKKKIEADVYLYHGLTLILHLETLINLLRNNSDFLLESALSSKRSLMHMPPVTSQLMNRIFLLLITWGDTQMVA